MTDPRAVGRLTKRIKSAYEAEGKYLSATQINKMFGGGSQGRYQMRYHVGDLRDNAIAADFAMLCADDAFGDVQFSVYDLGKSQLA